MRHAIEQSGYSIYKAANKSGINRTTLQKILADDRPVSQEQLEQILSVLKLSPAEEEDILTVFEISKSGETLHAIRQTIRHLFTAMFDTDAVFSNRAGEYSKSEITPPPNFLVNSRILSGSQQVILALRDLVSQECLKPNPCLRISLPGTIPILPEILLQPSATRLKVQQITRILRSADSGQDSLTNLQILSNLLPLSMLSSFDYQIHFFYDSQVSSQSLDLAFPYYALFSDTLMLLSPDCSVALPCTEASVMRYFNYLFEDSLRKTSCLIEQCDSTTEVLECLMKIDEKGACLSSIEYQPCLITFMEEEHFHRYAREEIEHRNFMIQAVIERKRQLAALTNRRCIFSKSGLAKFVSEGFISDLPSCYMKPLSIPDRIRVLEHIVQVLNANKWDFRITNPVTFPLPPRLACIIRDNIGVEFCHVSQEPNGFKHVHIREHTILDAFEDFFQYVMESSLVYTREETIVEIERSIQTLKDAAVIRTAKA